jgi:hypothetical protein
MTAPTASITELMIVPCHRGGDRWALVNRRGDLLAVGDYSACSQRLQRLSTAA